MSQPPVHIGRALLARCAAEVPALAAAHRVAIITDDTVAALHLPALRAGLPGEPLVLSIPAGEAQKTRETWARLTDALLAAGVGRDSVLVALGGGVIGDLTGFVAATYLRGIPFVQCPTTLLAMVDAALGGKTGVDTPQGKNLVGAFHHPLAVVSDLDTLATLPDAERRNGLAEVIKHGVIADAAYLSAVEAQLPWPATPAALETLVRGSVRVKLEVVARDFREQGLRKVLNFGHTIGHAIEHRLDYTLAHGACVAIGMVVETRLAVALGLAAPELPTRVAELVARAGLPHRVPATLDAEAILTATAGDKKARGGMVEYALPQALGMMAGADQGFALPVPPDLVRAALAASR